MQNRIRKIKQYFKLVNNKRKINIVKIPNDMILQCPCEYKKGNTPPSVSSMSPMPCDSAWGSGKDSHAWFYLNVKPESEHPYLQIMTDRSGWDADNPQFIVYINGEMRQGIDTNHTDIILTPGIDNQIWLYGYTGPKIESTKLFVSLYDLDTDVNELYYDIKYPLQMLDYLSPESYEYAEIVDYLYNAVSILDMLNDDNFSSSAKAASEYLKKEFYGNYCCNQKTTTVCIGHTHIDCAWKWTLLQTREKVQRSFSTVLELMNRYPEYKFMSSQALLYKDLKEEAPEKYEQVKARIREKRWEVEGSMWVEADCNLPSGESLVRQVLYGKRFFKDEFGIDTHTLWLPDVFGYSAALPQILRKSGVDWFVTSKISWNDTNRMPYDTFVWQGIDGTRINSYFLTAQNDNGKQSEQRTTYVANTNAQMVSGAYKRFTPKSVSNEALLTFGFGDGGGGPTAEHLELARRGSYGIPGSPNVKIEFAGDFLDRLAEKIKNSGNIPSWQGELYLEFHRGTYTTQARNKKNNRKCEFLYQNTELLSVIEQSLFGRTDTKAALRNGWEMILTNQFHDIIPGSSINEVYAQCEKDYAEIISSGLSMRDGIMEKLASALDKNNGYLVFNPNTYSLPGIVNVGGKTVLTDGAVAAKGYSCVSSFVDSNSIEFSDNTFKTKRFIVKFNDSMQIESVYDILCGREVLSGNGNVLRIYTDYPDTYDAWEWQAYSKDQYTDLDSYESADLIEDGIRRGMRIVRKYGKSTIEQTVWFYDDLGKIDFETKVEWFEKHKMLKAIFPVDINSDKATYDIQFGSIERPTHFNTSWEEAKFEVCAHKYADISEGNYGVSIINDCKYGHDIHNGVIQLSLLRSPTNPDPYADEGEHSFTYSICPHNGRLPDSDTVKLAYMLNNPMLCIAATGDKDTIPTSFSPVNCNKDNIIVDTVKQAEDGNDTIVRAFECQNMRGLAKFTLDIPASKIFVCDLMENNLRQIECKYGEFEYEFRGFDIVTFRIVK